MKVPESLNLYSYTQNDPVNFVDRTGNDRCWGWFWIIDGRIAAYLGISYCESESTDDPRQKSAGRGGGGAGQNNNRKKCPEKSSDLSEVFGYLIKGDLADKIGTKQVSASGKGFILTFNTEQSLAVKSLLDNKDLFAGGTWGGQLHEGEIRDFLKDQGLPYSGGTILDYRSFNAGNNVLGNKSLQFTMLVENNEILGAYVDLDQFNFRQDVVGVIGHTAEFVAGALKWFASKFDSDLGCK